MSSRSILIVASGVLMGVAMLMFADASVKALMERMPYDFLMWLPAVISLTGTIVLLFVTPANILYPDSDFDDDDAVKKEKIIFFAGVVLLFASIALSIWKAVDLCINWGAMWQGAALPIASLIVLFMNAVLFKARTRRDEF